MYRITAILLVTGLFGATSALGQASTPGAANYRVGADVQLQLTFQGIAEGGLSRGLRLFGGRGRCHAWYLITEVTAAPASMAIRAGQRLKLEYACGDGRVYSSGLETPPLDWARVTGDNAQVWLHSADISPGREQTWVVQNPANRLAPVAVQHQE